MPEDALTPQGGYLRVAGRLQAFLFINSMLFYLYHANFKLI